MTSRLGWECPACSMIHAPDVRRCECRSTGGESEAPYASPDTRHALGMPDAADMLLYGAAAIGSIAAWLAWAVWRMLT